MLFPYGYCISHHEPCRTKPFKNPQGDALRVFCISRSTADILLKKKESCYTVFSMQVPDNEEEINFEPLPAQAGDEELGDVAGAQAKVKKLREQLKEAQQKGAEYLDGWQRCKADSINGRKEALADAARRAAREKLSMIEDIIPVLDSFDMAAGSESWAEVSDGFRTGMEHVRNQLLDVLSRHGIERFGKIGEH